MLETENSTPSLNEYSLQGINKEVFRAYDIRGEIGKEWCLDGNYQDAYLIGQAIGSQLVRRNTYDIIVGRDGRISSEDLSKKLIEGIISTGCNVFDIGLVSTPVVYFALDELNIPHSIMVTGSHNPPSHNGIKIVYDSIPISAIVIETIYYDIVRSNTVTNASISKGKHKYIKGMIELYQKAIVSNIKLKKALKVGIDCGNGATSLYAESLFTELGCKVSPLFCELDGTFPNHSPDPTVPENLSSLSKLIANNNLDIGIAFDGDGDRMIAMDNKGNILWPDQIMILLAQNILKNKPNSAVVFDVKCSFLLPRAIKRLGGKPSMCVSGHSILKMQMQRLNAVMGGEFSGHIVLADRWSKFDDGPYVAARLLELLSHSKQTANEMFNHIPKIFSTPEQKLTFNHPAEAEQLLEQFIKYANFSDAQISLIDGIRVDYKDGWGLIRSSNTTASLTFRFEALTNARLKEIQNQFKKVLDQTDNNQALPF